MGNICEKVSFTKGKKRRMIDSDSGDDESNDLARAVWLRNNKKTRTRIRE